MFTRLAFAIAHIKLAIKLKKRKVCCGSNKLIKKILLKLVAEGYIINFYILDSNPYYFVINIKFNSNFIPVLRNIKLISTCGHRVYYSYKDVELAYKNGKYFILSTTSGLLSTTEIVLNKLRLGGEVILYIEHF